MPLTGGLTETLHTALTHTTILKMAQVADFQANPATGTSDYPQRINDGGTGIVANHDTIGEYSEVDFGRLMGIRRYRYWGHDNHNGTGRWKIQYHDPIADSWVDWVTGIVTRAASWSDFVDVYFVLTDKVRLVATTMDVQATQNHAAEWEIVI